MSPHFLPRGGHDVYIPPLFQGGGKLNIHPKLEAQGSRVCVRSSNLIHVFILLVFLGIYSVYTGDIVVR